MYPQGRPSQVTLSPPGGGGADLPTIAEVASKFSLWLRPCIIVFNSNKSCLLHHFFRFYCKTCPRENNNDTFTYTCCKECRGIDRHQHRLYEAGSSGVASGSGGNGAIPTVKSWKIQKNGGKTGVAGPPRERRENSKVPSYKGAKKVH